MSIATFALAAAGLFQAAPCNLPDKPASFEQDARVECGWVTVPRSRNDPGAGTLRLWTARIHANSDTPRDDPVVYIHGGPGIATVDSMLPWVDEIRSFVALRADRDIILFDQRGTGRSEQALCPDLGDKLNALSAQGLDPVTEDIRGRALFAACKATLDADGIDLADYSSAAIAADLDAIRGALQVERWNLMAVSYGTLVALDAMRSTPQGIRAVLLDSPYPPNSVAWAEQASTTAAAYQAIGRACAADGDCKTRFGDTVAQLEATLARLEATPLQDGETRITGRLFATSLWPLAVRSSTVALVPQAIHKAHAGDADTIKGLVRMFGGKNSFGDMSPAQAMAISCHEGGRTHDWFARARSLYPALVPATPDDSWDRLCATFRPDFAPPEFFAPVRSGIPTLIFAGTLDPATPAVDAYQSARFLEHATIVEVEGQAHAPLGSDDCTRGLAVAFLDQPEADVDLRCLAQRPPLAFPADGLAEVLAPPAEASTQEE